MRAFIKEKWPETLSWVVATATIIFALANHLGWIDDLRGLHAAEAVAERFDLSYGPDASAPVYAQDPAWPALIRVIREHSSAKIPSDRTPVVLARFPAVLSAIDTKTPGMPQWTVPVTQLALIYKMWPDPGAPGITPADYRIVGSIENLHDWIKDDSDDFHFYGSDILLTVLTLVIAITSTLSKRRKAEAE